MRKSQQGLGWFGLLYILGTLAVIAVFVIKSFPVYMNQMKVRRDVHKVAVDQELATAEPEAIHKALSKFWDIDNIDTLHWNDVKVKRTDKGRFLAYEYQVSLPMYDNISIVFDFKGQEQMANVQ